MSEIRFNIDNITVPLNNDSDGAREDDSTEAISDKIVKGDEFFMMNSLSSI